MLNKQTKECFFACDGISRNMVPRPATGHVACLLKTQITDAPAPNVENQNLRAGNAAQTELRISGLEANGWVSPLVGKPPRMDLISPTEHEAESGPFPSPLTGNADPSRPRPQHSLPPRMLMIRLPLMTVQPRSSWADVTESMVFSPSRR